MEKIKFISVFLCIFPVTESCSTAANRPVLTRESNRALLNNPPQNQETLKTGTFHGCVHIPATNLIQRAAVGFESTGETCSVTVSANNVIQVSFIGNTTIPVVSTSTAQLPTDLFIGELDNNQVIKVQHHQNEVVAVTQTTYDENGNVNQGQSNYIKECHIGLSTAPRLSGQNCQRNQ